MSRTEPEYKFLKAHPGGVKGCAVPLPVAVKAVLDEMTGCFLTLEAALARIQAVVATDWGVKVVPAHDEMNGSLLLSVGSLQDSSKHVWKLIEYLSIAPAGVSPPPVEATD